MKPADEKRFGDLTAWATRHGATLHPAVEIYHDEVTKISLRTKAGSEAVEAGEVIVSCPLSISISYLNALVNGTVSQSTLSNKSQTAAAFPARFMASVPPHVIGRFFLIQQYLLGTASFWYPYIQSLPQPEHLSAWALPVFWPQGDDVFLAGTNAAVSITGMQDRARAEFKHARRALKDSGFPGWQDYSRTLYNWAFCVFTSRSFTPLLVIPEATWADVKALVPEAHMMEDFSVLLPLFDIANHSPTAESVWDATSDAESCLFRCRRRCEPGRQIFNHYGPKTNSELLLAYGFLIPPTDMLHNDYVHLQKKTAVEAGDNGAGDVPVEELKPREFIISLRPVNHASSVVGRSRLLVVDEPGFDIIPEFAHVQDALVWDLALSLMTEDEKAVLQTAAAAKPDTSIESRSEADDSPGGTISAEDERRMLRQLLKAPPEPKLLGLIERISDILYEKLAPNLQMLLEWEENEENWTSPGGETGRRLVATNANQELALQYRKRYIEVLSNAVRGLESGVAFTQK